MTRPDWVPEALWEKANRIVSEALLYQRQYEQGVALELTNSIARAILQAKNEGKREAAEIAAGVSIPVRPIPGAPDGAAMARHSISQAILSSIQKEPK